MIEATGRVIATADGSAVVEVPRRSSCSSCASAGGCGVSTLAKLFGGGTTQVEIADSLGLRPGDKVVVTIGDGALVQASLLAYLLPILAMAAAAALAAQAGAGDMGSALAAAAGLGIGLLLTFQLTRARRLRDAFQPTLIRRITTDPLAVAMPTGASQHRPAAASELGCRYTNAETTWPSPVNLRVAETRRLRREDQRLPRPRRLPAFALRLSVSAVRQDPEWPRDFRARSLDP